ncbi:MAG: SDR family NAD(P)-dependent oxidoreductase [Deltaproteobacteria bacterium]|nr:SDR family NAD(P)-dependent oxidoreductase [Deltaproteobacteria bacterium]
MSIESQKSKPAPQPAGGAVPVAVIGLGALFPGGRPGLAGYWSLVRDGRDALTDVPTSRFKVDDYFDPDPKARDKIYARRGAFLPEVPFEPLRHGITPKDVEATDATQLLGLVAAEEALRDAGYPAESFDHRRTAVVLGVTGALKMVVTLGSRLAHPQLKKALADGGVDPAVAADVLERFAEQFAPWRETSFPGLLGNVTAGRIANRLNLGGANLVVDAACASSLAAVGQALAELTCRRADLVVSGGMDTFTDPFMFACFSKTPALSPTGEVRAFDENGDGTLLGEGLGVLVLKRLDDALRDGDRLYAVIRGVGASSDGRGTAVFAPSAQGQKRALEAAYAEAGWSPLDVELVEAHGTGTAVGDGAELAALCEQFGEVRPTAPEAGQADASGRPGSPPDAGYHQTPWCALGSVKSQIGHAKAAAGAAGLIKAVLALHHKVLPPIVKTERPLPPLAESSCPFYLSPIARPWLASPRRPRRAGVSAFGFGGSNFHCLLEEAAPDDKPVDDLGLHLAAVSADDVAEAAAGVQRLLGAFTPEAIDAQAASLNASFDPNRKLRLVFLGDYAQVIGQAAAASFLLGGPNANLALLAEEARQRNFFLGRGPALGREAKLTFLYPERLAFPNRGLCRELALAFPAFQRRLDLAEEIRGRLGLAPCNLGLLLDPPALAPLQARRLWAEALAQPAVSALILATLETALSDLLRDFGLTPAVAAGRRLGVPAAKHALGEISAEEALTRTVELALKMEADRAANLEPIEAVKIELAEMAELDAEAQAVKAADLVVVLGPEAAPPADARALRFPWADSGRSLGRVLGALAAAGLPVRLAAWPTLRQPEPKPKGHFLSLNGGNVFSPPPPRPPVEPAAEGWRSLLALQKESNRLLAQLSGQLAAKPAPPAPAPPTPAIRLGGPTVAPSEAGQRPADPSVVKTVPSSPLTTLRPPRRPAFRPNIVAVPPPDRSTLGKSNGDARPAEAAPAAKIWALLANVVAQETGYPPEALTREMSLEADLGLDSIKKVELLSAVSQQFPGLSSMNADLGEAQTLGRLADRCLTLSGQSSAAEMPAGPPPAPFGGPAPSDSSVAGPAGGHAPGRDDRRRLLFEILSQETGYPSEMLELSLDLETDLGLDSIKKVELLSTLAQYAPPAADFSNAKTLGDLLELLDSPGDQAEPAGRADAPRLCKSDQKFAPPQIRLEPPLRRPFLATVALETGYPPETLTPELELEGDLGLDSIKRVEILSLLAEGRPSLSPQDQALLAQARTLGDWRAFFEPVDQAEESSGPSRFGPAAGPTAGLAVRRQIRLASGGPSPAASGGPSSAFATGSAAPSAAAAPSAGRTLLDSLLADGHGRPSLWQVAPEPFDPSELGPGPWPESGLVRLVGTDPLTRGLEKELKGRGYEVERRSWRYDFQQWRDDGRQAKILILVWPGPDRHPDLITQALKALKNSGDSLSALAGVSFLGGFFGFPRLDGFRRALGNSTSGALAGLLKCAAQEWPQTAVRIVDLPLAPYESPIQNWCTAILAAAAAPGPVELGLPSLDHLHRLTLVPYSPAESPEPLLAPGETVVVTGGGRGVTAEVLKRLARLYRPRLIVLGRTPLPPPEPEWLVGLAGERDIKAALSRLSDGARAPRELEAQTRLILSSRELARNLADLAAAGAQVDYLPGDYSSPPAIEEAARRIRARYGPIRGFIHGAGVLADHPIKDKSLEDFARVYATKTQLASLLLEAFQPEPLRLMVFFSSSTARFGRQGQGDYAAGNEVLNKIAWEMTALHPRCRVLAVNWGPWAGGMVTDALAGQFRRQGVGLIGLAEGAETFLRLIQAPAGGPAEVLVLGEGTSPDLLSPYAPGGS